MRAIYDGQELNLGGREGIGNLTITVSRQVQVEPILRSDKVKVFARGNRVWNISFSFAREYETLEEANDAACELLENLPSSGDLELEVTGDNAAVQSTIFEDAVFAGGAPANLGKTIVIALSFVSHSRKVIPTP